MPTKEEYVADNFTMIFAAVRDGATDAVDAVQMAAYRGDEKRAEGQLLLPGEFAELIFSSRLFPPVVADNLVSRVLTQGHAREENVILTDENISFLRLNRTT